MSESTGTIIGEQLRQEMQAMRRDAERFRALAMACELHFSADEKRAIGMLHEDDKLIRVATLAELADRLISEQKKPQQNDSQKP